MINSAADWLWHRLWMVCFIPNIFRFRCWNSESAMKTLMHSDDRSAFGVFIPEVKRVGGAIMTVHYEACTHLHCSDTCSRQYRVSLNLTLKSLLEDIIEDVDLVLLMSVNPGFGGQKFIPRILDKVRDLKEMIARRNSHAVIEIDGGVNLDTGRQLVEAGADALVAGSFVFHSDNPIDTIARLKQL